MFGCIMFNAFWHTEQSVCYVHDILKLFVMLGSLPLFVLNKIYIWKKIIISANHSSCKAEGKGLVAEHTPMAQEITSHPSY